MEDKYRRHSLYNCIKKFLLKPFFRVLADIFSHGATHFAFFIVVVAITAYLWMLNNKEVIIPHNLGIHIGWTSNKSDAIQNMHQGYAPKDSIDNIMVHFILNSDEIGNRTAGKYHNGIIVEFDGKARIRDFVDGFTNNIITSYKDSVIFSLYSEPHYNSFDVIAKFDPLTKPEVECRDSILEDGRKVVVKNIIKRKLIGLAPDSVIPHTINYGNDGIVSVSLFPADYQSYTKQKTKNYIYFYSDDIGSSDNSPYYYYYFNIPPAKNAEIASIDFQFSDLIENEKFGMKYTKGKNLQFKYIFPEPDIIGNGRVEYVSEKKKKEIQKNQGIIIRAVDIDALNRQNRNMFLYSVLIGTGFAFLLDILIQLIRELRRLQKEEE